MKRKKKSKERESESLVEREPCLAEESAGLRVHRKQGDEAEQTKLRFNEPSSNVTFRQAKGSKREERKEKRTG